jgi:PHD/YefM family antitoxin component YafN of YafNO toxin-antitoxin module
LLRDDLTVAPGAALPSIEVTLRNDGAQLSVTVTEKGQPAAAGVVIYSEEYPRRSLLKQTNDTGRFSLGNLAPGKYQVIALKDAQDLEFRNPAAMDKYLEHASAVTLQSRDETSVRVEVQDPKEQQR